MAKLQSNLLSAEIVWMPSESDLNELKSWVPPHSNRDSNKALLTCKRVVSLRKALSTALHYAEIKFLDINLKKGFSFESVDSLDEDFYDVQKKASSLTYSEILYIINCEINTERNLSSYLRNLVNLFCTCKVGNSVKDEVWMTFDIAELVDEEIKPTSPVTEFKSFVLGNLVGLNTFVSHFDSTSALNEYGYKITQLKGRFLHDFQRLELYFVVGKAKLHVKKRSPETHRLFKLEIPYIKLNRILICDEKNLAVFLYFLNPPLLFGVVENPEAEMYTSFLNCSPETNWERILDLFEGSPLELRREFSMNTVLKLEFDSYNDYDCLIQLKHHCSHIELYFSPIASLLPSKNSQFYAISSTNFDCYYGLKCIVSRSFEPFDHVTAFDNVKEVNSFLSEKCKENPMLLYEILLQIYYALDQGNVVIFDRALKALFKSSNPGGVEYNLIFSSQSATSQKMPTLNEFRHAKGEIVYIRRAVVTPTHVRFVPDQPMLKSRLLRSCNPDFALRVSVRDVNLNGLSFTVKTASGSSQRELQVKFVIEHIKKQMLKGIKIGNRLYEYLGGSTSQLRSHGLWFYAKDDKNCMATDIRKTVGDLNEILLAPKYMARMGQSFSQAMGYITVPQEWTNVKCPDKDILGEKKVYASDSSKTEEESVEDYKRYLDATFKEEKSDSDEEPEVPDSERYNFTDGIGRMSQEIANLVYEKLELQDVLPPAMQIRYAGCKGMLVVDPRLESKKIVFRKSMKKFDSNNASLEILKTSYPRPVYLNRPFVTILEQMGIEKMVFLKLQKQEIQQLIKSIFYNDYAKKVLKERCQLFLDYTGLFDSGFSLTEDPFFRSMILAIFKREIETLKTKARILVDPEKGRTMFGVVDETSSLEYGEVFVQYTDFDTRDPKKTCILEGRVLITKNPCSHPGDVRIFRAVPAKDLEHIRDCVVFPAKGPRPHPDEMAGSDLDGDEYSVIWDPELMFERENYPAMHFAFHSEIQQPDKPVEITDELDFFCKYIMNSAVGVIASAWLAWADKHREGIFSKKCFSLAEKYSMALDFAKNGKSVQLDRNEYVHSYPDFMQKLSERDTYASQKALGCLYRNCKRLELGFEATTVETKFTSDKDLICESWEKYKDSAVNALKSYSRQVRHSLKTYGIDSEGELVSGALKKVSKLYEDRHDLSDLQNILEFEIRKLFQNLHKEFFAEFGGKPEKSEFTDDMRLKASAWYAVTYRQDNSSKESKYFGLPWAVTDVLIDIKNKKTGIKTKDDQASNFLSILTKKASFIETLIDESLKNRMEPLTASNFKLAMLDTAHDILTKWLKSQEKHLKVVDLKHLKECLLKVFDEISAEVYCCDDQYIEYLLKSGEKRKINSPAYYILETLMRIAELGTSEKESDHFDADQEFGLFAWVTLVKLGCSGSIEPLGITETAEEIPQCSYLVHKDEVDTIKIPLEADNHRHSEKQAEMVRQFRFDAIHDEEKVKEFLQKETQLKCVEMRAVEEKGKKYSLRLTVKGSRFAIERLKDLVVLPNFFESVILYKPVKKSKPNESDCQKKESVEKSNSNKSDSQLNEGTEKSKKLDSQIKAGVEKSKPNKSDSDVKKRSKRGKKKKMQQ